MKIADMFAADIAIFGRCVLSAADQVAEKIEFRGAFKVYTFKDKSTLAVPI